MMVWLVASAVCVCVGSGRAKDEGWVIGGVWEVCGGGGRSVHCA